MAMITPAVGARVRVVGTHLVDRHGVKLAGREGVVVGVSEPGAFSSSRVEVDLDDGTELLLHVAEIEPVT